MSKRWFTNVARAALLGVAAMALAVMYGWITHSMVLVQVRPDYPLQQFNTAVCLLLCAASFWLILAKRPEWVLLPMAVVLAITVMTFLEYTGHLTLGIDHLFVTPFTSIYTTFPGRMGLNTNIALILLSGSILACTRRRITRRNAIIIACATCGVFALGAVPLLGYASGIQEAYRFGTFTRMSLPASLSLIVLSVLLVLYVAQRSPLIQRWLPIPIFIALVMVSFSAAIAVRVHEEQQIAQAVQVQANEQAAAYTGKLKDLYGALNRISLRWEAAGGTPRDLWNQDTESYLRDMPFLAAITWLDTEDRLQWISPMKGNERFIGRVLSQDPIRGATIAKAKATQQAQVTPPVPFFDDSGIGFLYIRPLHMQGKYGGMLNVAIHVNDFFASLHASAANRSFHYLLKHGERILITTLPENVTSQQGAKWQSNATIVNLNDTYELTLYPSPEYVAAQHTFVPAMVFLGGSLMAALVALSTLLLLRERRQARLVREAELFNRTILQSASYLIIASDVEGKVELFNPEAERALGYKAEEIIGKQTAALWHDMEEVTRHLEELRERYHRPDLKGLDVFAFEALHYGRTESEWSFIRRDGSRFPGRLTVTPRRGQQGELLGYLGIVKDMTEQKRQEALLRSSEESFRLAMQYSPIGMALVSPEGAWLKVNQALCDIIGYDTFELLMTNFQTITHPDDLNSDLAYLNQMLAGEIKSYTMEKRYFHKTGHTVPIQLSVSLIRNEDGTPKYFISMIQDISERERLTDQLRQTNAELEQFAYVASHDLQEPLRMVTSFVGLLGQNYADRLDARGKEFITIAVDAAKRMQVLIHDLLDYARLGRDSQVRVLIDTNAEMNHVLLNLETAIQGANARLTGGTLPPILGNPVEFLRLMQNLIGNGIKFHRPDVPPIVEVNAVRDGEFWRFSVSDNGIGMKPEYYERVFQPFKRLHTQQEFQGSGIGLAVCRKIVENFGGRIWVESVPGQGSTIYFTVPVIA